MKKFNVESALPKLDNKETFDDNVINLMSSASVTCVVLININPIIYIISRT